jgi:hypothetical protein
MAVDLIDPIFMTPCAMRHADIKARLEYWRLTAYSKLADPTTVIKPRLHTTPHHTTPHRAKLTTRLNPL